MEAVAIHSFNPTNAVELGFFRSDVLKVINAVDDAYWYFAQLGSRQGFIPYNYIQFRDNAWYHGTISRDHAEMLLANQPCGSFLVRSSEYSHRDFSISLRCPHGVQHFRVRNEHGKFFLWNVKFDSLNELIDYYREVSILQSQEIFLQDMHSFQVQAVYDFRPQELDELAFRKGDIITVINYDDQNWWVGKIDQRCGQFPVNYVRNISP